MINKLFSRLHWPSNLTLPSLYRHMSNSLMQLPTMHLFLPLSGPLSHKHVKALEDNKFYSKFLFFLIFECL